VPDGQVAYEKVSNQAQISFVKDRLYEWKYCGEEYHAANSIKDSTAFTTLIFSL